MYRLSARLLPLLAALVLLGGSQARAEFVDYSFSWSSEPTPPIISSPDKSSSVSLALGQSGTAHVMLGDPNTVPAATISTTSTAGTGTPPTPSDHFDTSYSLTFHLTDTASGKSDALTFAGSLKGDLSSNSSSLSSTFQDPVQQLTLDNHRYTVTLKPALLSLPAPGSTTLAALNVDVKVDNVDQVAPAPEPSSLALAAAALSLFGLAARRRRRAARL
jgi:MYXO-CTERM domain-containing protein